MSPHWQSAEPYKMTCQLGQEISSEWALKFIRNPERLYDCSVNKHPCKEKNYPSFVTWSSEVGKHRIGFRRFRSSFCHQNWVALIEVCFDPQFLHLPPFSLGVLDGFCLLLWSTLHSLWPAFCWDRLTCVDFWLVYRHSQWGAACQESREREERRLVYYFSVFFSLSSVQGLPTEPSLLLVLITSSSPSFIPRGQRTLQCS